MNIFEKNIIKREKYSITLTQNDAKEICEEVLKNETARELIMSLSSK